MRARYEFKLLGPLEVRRDGLPVSLEATKLRLLLAALLLEAGRVVPVDTLTQRLWGEDPPGRARNTLQNYVLRLRRALGPGVVLTHSQGYLIEAGPDCLDLLRFNALVRDGRTALSSGSVEHAAVLLGEARGMWRGEPLCDLPAELVRDIAPALAEQRLDSDELWIEAELALGRSDAVLPELRTLVCAHPLRERFWAQRMLALYRCGRQGEALECYREATALLAEELGVDPGAELRTLHGKLLAAAPELGVPGGAAAADPRVPHAHAHAPHAHAPHTPHAPHAPHVEAPPATPHVRSLPIPRTSLPHTPRAGHPPTPCTGNLPAETTTFVGREVQLAHARALLTTSRLVSLTGVGGVGKTRLALRVAAEAAGGAVGSRSARPFDLFPDGVWLADLAPLTEPALLDRAVAASLDLRDQSARPAADAVAEHLRDRRLLLVLDNCEHLVEAVATLVLRLLRAAPGLRVLATSRERLGVPGEYVLLVPSLTLPRPEGFRRLHPPDTPHAPHAPHRPYGSSQEATHRTSDDTSEAFRLLVERARAAAPAFRVTDRNSGALAQLCHRLDGIPLAVELAAVRLGTMAPEEILDRLDDRFRLLSVPHTRTAPSRYQQTLRGVVDWSHDLCTEGERLLWARLSVFSGSFDLEAAEAVCAGVDESADEDDGDDGDGDDGEGEPAGGGIARENVLDLLTGLVDKSIVMVETDADGASPRARYRLLETIRQYGRHRLRSAEYPGRNQDATTALRLRHCAYYRSLTARAAAEWCGPDEADWLSRLDRDLPNLRAALDFCGTQPGRAVVGLEIAVNLTRTRSWFFCSTLGEGRHWLERLHGQVSDLPPELGVTVAAMKSWIAICQGDVGAPRTLTAECVGPPGPAGPAAPALFIEGAHSMLVLGEPASIDILVRTRAGFLAAGHTGDAHMCTMLWAMAAAFLGERETAFLAREVYVAEAERAGAYWAQTWAQWCAGVAELRHGDPARAIAPMRGALVRQHGLRDRWGPVWNVETLAWAVAATGRHHRAARLLGAAHRLREITGVALIGLRPLHDVHLETVELVRTALGRQGYEEAWERGAAAEDSVALALELTDGGAAP
ncbi:BTAD domain-containing putative transcriptional regulator [Streptomyces sp. NPDC048442]|uniref:AfsR/SARP family transcriptional regulator n=1 Tax=Streptomyces sp. NPDC048442 TaxID=3154823 RepID=UPI0034343BFB